MIIRKTVSKGLVTILLTAFFMVRIVLALDSFMQIAYDFRSSEGKIIDGSTEESDEEDTKEVENKGENSSRSTELEQDSQNVVDTEEGKQEEQESEDLNDPEPEPKVSNISCFGDSVTWGTPYAGTSDTYPAKLQTIINSNFGSDSYIVVNRGVGGYRADQVLASAQGWLNSDNPKIVLLMVGGNDLNQGLTIDSTLEEIQAVVAQTVSEVQQIVSVCKAHTNPDGTHPKVILSAFIPNNYQGIWGSMAISYYNSGLSGINGEDIYFTDNWSDLYDTSTFQAKTSLMYDTFHPNSSGYSIMAGNWYERVILYLD